MKDNTGGRGFRSKRDGSADLLGPTSEIGRKLKEHYEDIVNQKVPDRFDDLLNLLERTEKDRSNPTKSKG